MKLTGPNGETGPATVLQGETPEGHLSFTHPRAKLELMADEPGMIGYLAPKYVLTDYGTYFTDGAFTKTADEQGNKAHHLLQHWPDLIIGKHFGAEEDATGLKVTVKLNEEKQLAKDVMSDYRFGIDYGWSYGFDSVRDRSGTEADDKRLDRSGVPHLANVPINELRAINETRMWEGSTVTWGAIYNAGPDVIQRRKPSRAELARITQAVKDGTLDAELYAQIDELIEAYAARAGAGEDHATPPHSQAFYAAELDILFLELGVIEGVTS
jgi:HK97 family phage prohead protease